MPAPSQGLFLDHVISLSFDLPETLVHVSYLRKKARSILASLDVARADIDDIETVIGELATNAVRHAKGGRYRVVVELSENCCVVTVIDNGPGFVPSAVAKPGTSRPDSFDASADDRIGGFGLPLVRSLADQVDITRNHRPAQGMTIRASIPLRAKV